MNIFQLANELQEIVNELEENGGEITPEIEEQLDINQAGVKHKVEAFTQVIHQLESDIEAIKNETKRFADLKKRKEATIESVKKLILYSIDMFGETAKSGTKFIDFGTGKVSTRKSETLEIDTDAYDKLADKIKNIICWNGFTNNVNVIDLSMPTLIDTMSVGETNEDTGNVEPGINMTEDDLYGATANLIIPIKVYSLESEKDKELIQDIARLANDKLKVEVNVDKQYLKNTQKSEASDCKLSKLIQKTNVIIK